MANIKKGSNKIDFMGKQPRFICEECGYQWDTRTGRMECPNCKAVRINRTLRTVNI